MKIEFQAIGGSGYTAIADDTTTLSGRMGPDYVFWTPPGFDAHSAIVPLPRTLAPKLGAGAGQNRTWKFAFKVKRTFTTRAAAIAFIQSHTLALPATCDLKLTQDSGITYLHNSELVTFHPSELNGVTHMTDYTFNACSYSDS